MGSDRAEGQGQSPGDVTERSGVIRGYPLDIVRLSVRRVQPVTSTTAGPWVEAWLSVARFGVYLTAAGGDRTAALALYEWNAAVSAGFLHDLAHLEVGLRNAYDSALTTAIPAGRPHWVFDADRYFPPTMRTARNGTRYDANRINRDQLGRAVAEATAPTAQPSTPPPGKVVAELMFGFWRYLSTKAHDQRLWIPLLHKGFVPGTVRPAVDRPIGRLHQLRNRIAHYEPLLAQDLTARHDVILAVAALIAPELRGYIGDVSPCPALIDRRP